MIDFYIESVNQSFVTIIIIKIYFNENISLNEKKKEILHHQN